MQKIAIIGQGYVGLPLSLLFAESGIEVCALDVDASKVDKLRAGKSYIRHITEDRIATSVGSGKLLPSANYGDVADASAVIICVPTPLDKYKQPDMSFVESTARSMAPFLKGGTVVVLESTAYPGATEELLVPTIEQYSQLKLGKTFNAAFSPEREDPGNAESKVKLIPKLVGGMTPACLEKAISMYSRVIDTVIPVSSCRVAEAAKLTENIFRSVNIAMINELKMIYTEMGIDVWEVIEAAKTKPFGFMPFYPGPGLGGHCIPIDPFYLSWKAKELGLPTKFVELAGEVNHQMPGYVVQRLTLALNDIGKAIKSSRILIVGMAYKKNVDDMRESPALAIMENIDELGGQLEYYDPYIPAIPNTRAHARWAGLQSIDWETDDFAQFDAVVITTSHDGVDYQRLLRDVPVVLDTRNAISKEDAASSMARLWKA
ncbi:MAG: nucleotide sugar dehydrogenase [Opitutales bacterium]